MSAASPAGTTLPQNPQVLLAGASRVGKSSLRQSITKAQDRSSDSCIPWTIETKYYTATLDVCEASFANKGAVPRPEALVLVFSLAAPTSFLFAQTFSSQLNLDALEVKLLCGTHADVLVHPSGVATSLETGSQPDWFQQAAAWSVENGFEFIICCPAMPSLDATLSLDGDRQGVARVEEALHTHAWPNLSILPQGLRRPNNTTTLEPESGCSRGCAAGTNASSHAVQSTETTLLEEHEMHPGQRRLPRDAQGADEQAGANEVDELEFASAERMLDGLELLMTEMKEQKSRLATLPDEERREQAALIALRMLEMLGVEDEDVSSNHV